MQGEELGFRTNYNHFQRVNSFLSLQCYFVQILMEFKKKNSLKSKFHFDKGQKIPPLQP